MTLGPDPRVLEVSWNVRFEAADLQRLRQMVLADRRAAWRSVSAQLREGYDALVEEILDRLDERHIKLRS